MAKMLNTTALCTPEQVLAAALGSEGSFDKIFAEGAEFLGEGLDLIHSASDRVRNFLSRDRLMASKNEQLLAARDWRAKDRTPGDYTLRLTLERWPLVTLLSSYDGYDVATRDGRYVFASTRREEAITYIAGYRRRDQEVSDFPQAVQDAVASIDDIPLLPEPIVEAAKQVTIIRARHAAEALKGQSNVEQNQGEFSTSISISQRDKKAELDELRKIYDYKRAH